MYVCNMHIIGPMTDDRTLNLLGALVLALADTMKTATESRAEQGAGVPAALITIGFYAGESIDTLAHTLGLSHSATVRLVDRLVKAGLAVRRSGADRRTSALYLSRRGKLRMGAILESRKRVLEQALLPLTQQEQTLLAGLLEKLLGGFTRDRQHADHICRLCDARSCPEQTCPVECALK